MIHLPHLITDLGLILAAAGFTTLLFKKINQPIVLGYILAGLLVGPHFTLLPTVADDESIKIWAEIGVIFLLFNLGLEFSFKKLANVGGTASVTAVVEVVFMLLIGYLAGVAMGWKTMDAIFLGGILSVSSTTIIIRAFEELNVKHKKFAGLVFGVLIVEDLVAILLLVLLSTLAVSQQFSGTEMLVSVLKLVFFLTLWFLGGIFLIPTFLKRTRSLMTDETMLIVSIALCIAMVILAVQVGFSPALGAFIMGSILAETTQAERIEHLTKSVKDLFAAVFFVSVGMLIDPRVLVDYALPIVVITLATIFGKFISSGSGMLLSGQSLKNSVQSGMSLAQIGEFSFIIATLGVTLKVTSDFLYPIAVAVSAVTTFTTPYLIKVSEPFYQFLERTLPQKWVKGLSRYSSDTQNITTMSDWKKLLKAYAYNSFIHGVIMVGIIVASMRYLHPFITENITNGLKGTLITIGISLVVMAPFLWAFTLRRIEKKAYSHLWLNKKNSRGPLIVLELLRVLFGLLFVGFLLIQYFDKWLGVTIILLIIGGAVLLFSRKLQSFYDRLENRFLSNLNEREEEQNAKNKIAPWETHLAEFEISPQSSFIGKTLMELGIREQYGVNIALIERGKLVLPTPGPNERLYPLDKLTVIGTDEEIASVKALAEEFTPDDENQSVKKNMELQQIVISSQSSVCGTSIRQSGIRENAQGLIAGIEREGKRVLNPESTWVFQPGDIVWIVGNKKKIIELLR